MGNPNPRCDWPTCSCQTEKSDPCKYENPDFHIAAAVKAATALKPESKRTGLITVERSDRRASFYVARGRAYEVAAAIGKAGFDVKFAGKWNLDQDWLRVRIAKDQTDADFVSALSTAYPDDRFEVSIEDAYFGKDRSEPEKHITYEEIGGAVRVKIDSRTVGHIRPARGGSTGLGYRYWPVGANSVHAGDIMETIDDVKRILEAK